MEKYAIDEPTLTGRIEVWEPPRRFVWTWGGDLLIFELTAVDDGTELVFTTWPEDPDLAGIVSTAGGYHLCLAELTLLLDTGSAPPMTEVDEVAFRLTETYRQQFDARLTARGRVASATPFVRRPCHPDDTARQVSPVGPARSLPLGDRHPRPRRADWRRAHPEAGATPDLYCHLPKGSRP